MKSRGPGFAPHPGQPLFKKEVSTHRSSSSGGTRETLECWMRKRRGRRGRCTSRLESGWQVTRSFVKKIAYWQLKKLFFEQKLVRTKVFLNKNLVRTKVFRTKTRQNKSFSNKKLVRTKVFRTKNLLEQKFFEQKFVRTKSLTRLPAPRTVADECRQWPKMKQIALQWTC
jgi:hypothetical protein